MVATPRLIIGSRQYTTGLECPGILRNTSGTCDICQKTKPRRHAPVGMLQPILIPSQPFEVVSMDFIPELPESDGYDNILVIVDKLTKYAIFIPTTTTITEKGTAELFFRHVIAQYGIPRQVISDRDTRWKGEFWKEICDRMGMKRALTTAYHPQADGQNRDNEPNTRNIPPSVYWS